MYWAMISIIYSLEIGEGYLGGYFNITQFQTYLNQKQIQYQEFASQGTIGTTQTNGQSIPYLKFHTSDGLVQEATRPLILSAALYSGFPLSTASVLYAIDIIAEQYELLSERTVYFIPIINLDAYQLMEGYWSQQYGFYQTFKNTRATCQDWSKITGVNLNRNFQYEWGRQYGSSEDGCENEYRGSTFFSESETIAIKNLMQSVNSGIWMHFDRNKGRFVHPYSYVSSSGDSLLNMTDSQRNFYSELFNDYKDGVSYGSAQEMIGLAQSGTLIDYAFKQGFLSLELGVYDEGNIEDNLEDLDDIIEHFFKSSKYDIDFEEGDIVERKCGDGYECSEEAFSYLIFPYFFDNSAPVSSPDFSMQFQLTEQEYTEYSYKVTQVYQAPYADSDDFSFDEEQLESYLKDDFTVNTIGEGGTGIDYVFQSDADIVTALVVIVERFSVENANATVTAQSEFIAYPTAMQTDPGEYQYSVEEEVEISDSVDSSGSDDDDTRAMIGLIVGMVFLGLFLIIAIWVAVKIYKNKQKKRKEDKQNEAKNMQKANEQAANGQKANEQIGDEKKTYQQIADENRASEPEVNQQEVESSQSFVEGSSEEQIIADDENQLMV